MVSIEKELMGIISNVIGENYPLLQDGLFQIIDAIVEPLAKAIIAKYPQLLAEKVIDAETEHNNYFKVYCKPNTCIQIFIREVQ